MVAKVSVERAVVEIAERLLLQGSVAEEKLVERILLSPDCPRALVEDPDASGDIVEILRNDDRFWDSIERSVSLLTSLVSGTVLTHRISEEDLEAGSVAIVPDLELGLLGSVKELRWNPRGDGGPDTTVVIQLSQESAEWDGERLTLPMMGVKGARALVLRRAGDEVHASWLDHVPLGGDREQRCLAELAGKWLSVTGGVDVLSLILHARAVDDSLFRSAVRPISEMISDLGFRCVDGLILRSSLGLEWSEP
jgi:hypothetical protein